MIFWKLYVNWVPKLIQKSFQTREKQFVQRWETKVGANACKGSYLFPSSYQLVWNNVKYIFLMEYKLKYALFHFAFSDLCNRLQEGKFQKKEPLPVMAETPL